VSARTGYAAPPDRPTRRPVRNPLLVCRCACDWVVSPP
jgi:hypothetical protein